MRRGVSDGLRCMHAMRRASTLTSRKRLEALVRHVGVETLTDGSRTFVGGSHDLGWGRIYGGQTMAQAVAACQAVVAPRVLHQFSCNFLAGGDVSQDVTFETDVLTSGRSFSVVHVRALQDRGPILSMTASFQSAEEGLEHQSANGIDPRWRSPDELSSLEEHMAPWLIERVPQRMHQLYTDSPFDIRPTTFVAPWDATPHEPSRAYWMRARDPATLPDDTAVHQRLLTYLSDWGLLETAILPHPTAMWRPEMQVASLSHTMHFHHQFRFDERWLLHVMRSPSASGGRGYALGEVYREDGLLVASTAQEGLMRHHASVESRQAKSA